MIAPPPRPEGHPDRALDCEEALEDTFSRLCDTAEAAGWEAVEVDAALMGLVEARVAARAANLETEAAIARARRKVSQ